MEWLVGISSAAYVVVLIFEIATGQLRLRDERGRLRPLLAALAAVVLLVLVGSGLALILG